MANKQDHLRKEERFLIEKCLQAGDSYRAIARRLSRGVSTVSTEVGRGGGRETYRATYAQRRAYWKQYRKKRSCLKVGMSPFLARFVEEKIRQWWSPEAISAHIRTHHPHERVSPKAIRRFVKRRSLDDYLYRNRVRPRPKPPRSLIEGRTFVDTVRRDGYGHFEGDFLVSGKSATVLLVLVERCSKETIIRWLPQRTNDLVNQVICSALRGKTVKSLTLDNDIAFVKHRSLSSMLHAPVYFARPYRSTDKPIVENTNRWIRQFVPKRTDINTVTPSVLNRAEVWLNQIPRKSLGWRTAKEMAEYYQSREYQLTGVRCSY